MEWSEKVGKITVDLFSEDISVHTDALHLLRVFTARENPLLGTPFILFCNFQRIYK